MRLILICAVMAVAIPAWALDVPELSEPALKKAFESELKDADSAKFRDIKYKETGSGSSWNMCGEVNAKNSYGGYSGYEPFMATVYIGKDGQVGYFAATVGKSSAIMCERYGVR